LKVCVSAHGCRRECQRSSFWMAPGVKPPRCCTGVRICRGYPGWPFNLAPLPPIGCAASVMLSTCPPWKWLLHSWSRSRMSRPVVSCTPIFACLPRDVWPHGMAIHSQNPCQKWRNSWLTIRPGMRQGIGMSLDCPALPLEPTLALTEERRSPLLALPHGTPHRSVFITPVDD